MTDDDEAQEFYGFGALTNHSCDPSTSSENDYIYVDGKPMYQSVALRDIKAGEEVTEDYALNDWYEDEDVFDCMCGSNNCRGLINGFKFLPYDNACKLLGQLGDVNEDIRERWLECHPEVVLHQLILPEGIALKRCLNSIHGLKIVASTAFGKGDTLYTDDYVNIDTKVIKKIIISCPHPDAPNTLKQTCIIDLSSNTSNENEEYQFCAIEEFKSSSNSSD